MITIAEFPHAKLYWYDVDRSILVADIYKDWSWSEAQQGLKKLNETVGVWADTRPVYVILNLALDAHTIPQGGSSLQHMRQLLADDPSYETLTIVVGHGIVLSNIIHLASRLYQVTHHKSKYRYVITFEQALEIIKAHKANQ